MAKNALAAHARDELGLSEKFYARPLQAALSSAVTFSVGAALPIATALPVSQPRIVFVTPGVSLSVPRSYGSARRAFRRRFGVGWCRTRHLLGRIGDGCHSRCGEAVQNDCVLSIARLLIGFTASSPSHESMGYGACCQDRNRLTCAYVPQCEGPFA